MRSPSFLTAVTTLLLVTTIAAVVLAGQGVANYVALVLEPPEPTVTANVQVGQVTQHIDVVGEVRPDFRIPISVPESGASRSVITWTASSSTGIASGQRLLDVAGQPVVLLTGPIPMYRDLTAGLRGPDISQLQSALRQAGIEFSDTDGYLGWPTARALLKLFAGLGLSITDATGRPLSSGNAGLMLLPAGAIAYVPTAPVNLVGDCGDVGTELENEACFVESVSRSAFADFTVQQGEHVRTGDEVQVTFADGAAVRGTLGEQLLEENSPAQSSAPGDEGESAGAPSTDLDGESPAADHLTYRLDIGELPPVRATEISVTVIIASTAVDVLIVPEAAIRTKGALTSFVDVLQMKDGEAMVKHVPVVVGLCSDGECEITSDFPALRGASVVVSGTSSSQ